MDLASGYSDSTNYGNGYTPLANNAINNNNANYWNNQNYASQVGSYDPFAQSGGFGAQTDYYSKLGSAYTGATGGNIYGGGNNDPFSTGTGGGGSSVFDTGTSAVPSSADWDLWRSGGMKGAEPGSSKGIGSDAGQSPSQYQNQYPVVDWNKWATQVTDPVKSDSNPNTSWGGDRTGTPDAAYDPSTYAVGQSGWGSTPSNPSSEKLLGYTPSTLYSGGGIGSDKSSTFDTGASAYNPYGVDANTWSGMSAGDRNTFNNTMKASGQGGIGSDTARDKLAWTMATSSPYAETSTAPSNSTPNIGYNPGMENYFANPSLKQYDWTKNNDQLQQQMEDALKTIDTWTNRS